MSRPRYSTLLPWLIWLVAFFSVRLTVVVAGNHWQTLRDHWGIALAMAIGSYAAGSTPIGGRS